MEIIKQLFSRSSQKIYIGFEDIKYAISNKHHYMIINTLSAMNQECLIEGTLPSSAEEGVINSMIESSTYGTVILYGKNSADESVITKKNQLQSLGFRSVYIYGGGLFEWLLLQDIYGYAEFPTTTKCKDILQFRPETYIKRPPLHAITY
jgi:hypothetical protein